MSIIKKFRPTAIYVTDFSGLLWCEKQFEYVLEFGRKKTKAMKSGTKLHEELHEEVTELVEVTPKTREDFFALKMFNCIQALENLEHEKITRELPIIGFIDNLFISGYIDELVKRSGKITLIDTKTRASKTCPSNAQKMGSHLQLMCYKYLIEKFRQKKNNVKIFLDRYKLNSNSKISDDFKKQFEAQKVKIDSSVKKLAEKAFEMLSKLPEVSNDLIIRYVYQLTGEPIQSDVFNYDEKFLMEKIDYLKEYIQGKRKAKKVAQEEKWKCEMCEFYDKCKGSKTT